MKHVHPAIKWLGATIIGYVALWIQAQWTQFNPIDRVLILAWDAVRYEITIKIWHVIIVTIIIGVTIKFVLSIIKSSGPPYSDFRSMDYMGMKWEWLYDGNGRIIEDSVRPLCGQCNRIAKIYNKSPWDQMPKYEIKCGGCNTILVQINKDMKEIVMDVIHEIDSRIRNNSYPKRG